MSDLALAVENLGKVYQIGERIRYTTLRDSLGGLLRQPLRRPRREKHRRGRDKIWALRDVSFSVKDGEVVGVIGRNGAGKTTLLKILSRITEPTAGFADVYGRVGSLLEVGTGFHLELTGRENIFLNGAILGMKRQEIDRKFDEIVDFSGVEKFIDTPVKHYSSGMYLRLAFSVAAYLEPEILLVDEVLAVGDAEFQKKCLGKMENVAESGRTVLFVSHNMAAVNNLCQRVIHLDEGRVVQIGPTDDVVAAYLESTLQRMERTRHESERPGSPLYLERVSVGSVEQTKDGRTTVTLTTSGWASETLAFTIEWHLKSILGQPLAFGSLEHFQKRQLSTPAGEFAVEIVIKDLPLGAGRYVIGLRLGDLKQKIYYDVFDHAASFDVESFDPYQVGRSYHPKKDFGPFHFPDQFTIVEKSSETRAKDE